MHRLLPHPRASLVILKFDLPLDGFDRGQVTYIIESRIRAYGTVAVLMELRGNGRTEDQPLLSHDTASLIARTAIIADPSEWDSANILAQNISHQRRKLFEPTDRASALSWVQH